MKSENLVEISEKDFDGLVLKSSVPVMVEFGAPWCPPCRALLPVLDDLAADFKSRAQVYNVDVDNNQALAAQYRVQGLPTVILFKAGEIQVVLYGKRDKSTYIAALNKLLIREAKL